VPYIDWAPFFHVWELRGTYPNRGYPRIFDDATVGAEARKVFDDAQAMLKEIIDGKWLTARGVVGIYPAESRGDDVAVWAPGDDAARANAAPAATFCMLRQQAEKETDEPFLSLADFVAPASSGLGDYMGAFAVGVFGGEAQYAAFAADHNDFKKIMLQALSDRFAEAFAEQIHERMRRELWGYAPDEALGADDMHKASPAGGGRGHASRRLDA
jgi:5-methyltetrahydrofolate--homocysteine methyltransferase